MKKTGVSYCYTLYLVVKTDPDGHENPPSQKYFIM